MDLNWVVLFREIEIGNRRIRRDRFADPLADPLDRPEWRGFSLDRFDHRASCRKTGCRNKGAVPR